MICNFTPAEIAPEWPKLGCLDLLAESTRHRIRLGPKKPSRRSTGKMARWPRGKTYVLLVAGIASA